MNDKTHSVETNRFRWFTCSAGCLLLVTGIAKLTSSLGSARVLAASDPILAVRFRYVFVAVGLCEVMVAAICLLKRPLLFQVSLVAWISSGFLAYRIGLIWIGYQMPCRCLGTLTSAIHVPPEIADVIMKVILAYLLIGSYTALFWFWWQRKKGTASVAVQ